MSSPSDGGFLARLRSIRARLDRAATSCGRSVESVRLVGVAKRHPEATIQAALDAGLKDIGENFVQEWRSKAQRFAGRDVRWHYMGNLQRNKVKHLAGLIHLIHSVDRLSLLQEINRHAVGRACVQGVLIQVNVASEARKGGVGSSGLNDLYDAALAMEGVEVRGLMIFPPLVADPEEARPWFRAGRELLEALHERTPAGASPPSELSMGMSNDFEVAIEEGATLIRIGTALFGARPNQ